MSDGGFVIFEIKDGETAADAVERMAGIMEDEVDRDVLLDLADELREAQKEMVQQFLQMGYRRGVAERSASDRLRKIVKENVAEALAKVLSDDEG